MRRARQEIGSLTETFVQIPSFALAYGAFCKLYENDGHPTNSKTNVLTKLLDFCLLKRNYEKSSSILLNENDSDANCDLPIRSVLSCYFCGSVYRHPITLSCGHTFCRRCVESKSVCHLCVTTSTCDYQECLLIGKLVERFFPLVHAVYVQLDFVDNLVRQGNFEDAINSLSQLPVDGKPHSSV